MAPGRQLAFLWGGAALACAAAAPFARDLAAGAPVCAFRAITGVPCPTCGGTRALLALARLDAGAALAWNPLVTLGVAVFFLGGLVALVRALRGLGVPDAPPPRWAGAAAGLALAANWAFVVLTGR
ncbi:MAG TPA: DUF2752 domain-containing protein [Thermoanaerobaculia bacterium]